MAVQVKDCKKGTRVQLRNGWFATLVDNARGNIRYATVEGIYTETGSIYSHDIARAQVNGVWQEVELTAAQIKCREMNRAIFGG